MNVLLLRWDTKPDKRIRGTFPRPASTRRTSFYAADSARTIAASAEEGKPLDLTDRLAAVATLYQAHLNALFPSRWRGADVAGFDMILLDSFPSGCISVWLAQAGVLDDWRWNILAEYGQRLLRVIPELDDYGREYYQRILNMAELILEVDCPSPSA